MGTRMKATTATVLYFLGEPKEFIIPMFQRK